MKSEASAVCASCAAPLERGMSECPRCGRPIVRPEKPTSIVVRAVTVAFALVAVAISWTTVVGVAGWFTRLITSMAR